jgi:hypothetical protein
MESSRWREEAETMKPGPAREDLLRKARQAETGRTRAHGCARPAYRLRSDPEAAPRHPNREP